MSFAPLGWLGFALGWILRLVSTFGFGLHWVCSCFVLCPEVSTSRGDAQTLNFQIVKSELQTRNLRLTGSGFDPEVLDLKVLALTLNPRC